MICLFDVLFEEQGTAENKVPWYMMYFCRDYFNSMQEQLRDHSLVLSFLASTMLSLC